MTRSSRDRELMWSCLVLTISSSSAAILNKRESGRLPVKATLHLLLLLSWLLSFRLLCRNLALPFSSSTSNTTGRLSHLLLCRPLLRAAARMLHPLPPWR